jgi:drug/metabolite transporter (DMT)-like permease
MGFFLATDTLSKVAVTVLGMPVLQMLTLRGLGMVIVHGLVSLSHDCGRVVISRRDACIMVARVLLEVLSSWFFNLALMNLSMANAVAIVQALPLAVMLGAAVLGEPIGLSGWLLALLGFAGVLVIVHPTAEGIDPWSLCALAAVLTMATRDLGTRSLKDSVPSSLVALAASLGLTLFSYIGSWMQSDQWTPLGWTEVSCLVSAALTAAIALLASVSLMRQGSVSFVQPFRYTLLLWASFFGYLAFAEVPDAPTIVGSIILVIAGSCSVRLEQIREKEAKVVAEPRRAPPAGEMKPELGGARALV